jgi:outer membrane lipase/esterase
LGTALAFGLAAGAATAQSQPFDSMTAFGDSLSDSGNLSLSLGLPRARFTTNPGLTTVEDVGQHYGLALEPSVAGGSDYAYGGAGVLDDIFPVPTVPEQLSTYLGAHPQADPRGLYAIWGGNNDVFFHSDAITAGTETLDQASVRIVQAAQTEGQLIDRLQAAGVRHFIVLNLPDSGLTTDGTPQDTVLSETYNAQLNRELAGRRGIVPVNVFLLERETVANPAAAGFTNVTQQGCTVSLALFCTPSTLVQPDAASTYLFADDVHPTTAGHLGIAEVVIAELNAPGQMSFLAEAPLALLRGHRAAVADELDKPSPGAGFQLFASGRAGVRRLDGDWAAPDARSIDQAFTAGGVWRSGGGLALGLAITTARSQMRLADALGGFNADEIAGSGFARMDWSNGVWTSFEAGVGRADYGDIQRSFILGPGMRTENASTKGSDYSFEAAAGAWLHLADLRTGPFAAFAYDRVHVKGLSEVSGDSTAMWFAPQVREAEVARIGWKLDGGTRLAGLAVRPVAEIAYAHDFGAGGHAVTAGLTTFNGEFDMPGWEGSHNWGEARLGLETELAHGLVARLGYDGLFGDKSRENLGQLGVSLAF